MDATWVEFAKQAPNLCGLIFIIVSFLRHIKDGERERAESEKQKNEIFSAVIERNSKALERNSEMFGRAAHVFDERHQNCSAVSVRHK